MSDEEYKEIEELKLKKRKSNTLTKKKFLLGEAADG